MSDPFGPEDDFSPEMPPYATTPELQAAARVLQRKGLLGWLGTKSERIERWRCRRIFRKAEHEWWHSREGMRWVHHMHYRRRKIQ